MKIYDIIAEYGPVASDHIQFYVVARDKSHAMSEAISVLERDYEHVWNRIGVKNIHVRDHIT